MLKRYGSLGLAAVLAAAALVWTADAQQTSLGGAYASSGGQQSSGGQYELITHFLPADGKPTTLTVVDPAAKRIVVYHVARDTGVIELKSVRNLGADLGLDYWNSGSPLPEEIRKGIERTAP